MKKRVDLLLVEQKQVETRSRAAALIMAGSVEYRKKDSWEKVSKAGQGASPCITHFRLGLTAYRLNGVPTISPLLILRKFSHAALVATELRNIFQTLPRFVLVQLPNP